MPVPEFYRYITLQQRTVVLHHSHGNSTKRSSLLKLQVCAYRLISCNLHSDVCDTGKEERYAPVFEILEAI